MSDLYESDFLAWSERQAALLRQLADGQRVNEAVDWPNVIEEVQDLGISELRSCQSMLRQALLHLLKLQVWHDSLDVPHWRIEVSGFLADARKRYTPSMRQRLGLDDIYADALSQVLPLAPKGAALPHTCPLSINDLLSTRPAIDMLLGKLAGSGQLAPPPDRA